VAVGVALAICFPAAAGTDVGGLVIGAISGGAGEIGSGDHNASHLIIGVIGGAVSGWLFGQGLTPWAKKLITQVGEDFSRMKPF
jgi:hypothetical protein